MSLKHIMLGMLSKPSSGYDIKKEFEQSLQNFWHANLSQIYPMLQKMQDDGLVTSEAGSSRVGPTRRVYERSDEGRRELQAWLLGGPAVGTERVGYLSQVYFLGSLNDEDKAVGFMEDLRNHMANWLAALQASEEEWKTADPRYPDALPDDDFYSQLTLDLGLRKVKANVEWCDEVIQRIRARKRTRAGSMATFVGAASAANRTNRG